MLRDSITIYESKAFKRLVDFSISLTLNIALTVFCRGLVKNILTPCSLFMINA